MKSTNNALQNSSDENYADKLKKQFIDESYRMDDNSNVSKIAQLEGNNIDDELMPGIGIEVTEE